MNQTQIKYVRQRIEEIYNTKRASIKSKYIWVRPVRTLEEKLEAIKSGNYTVKDNVADYAKYLLDARVLFGDEENPNLKAEAEAYDKLRNNKTDLLDNLILGDSETMLAALVEFEKEEY